MKRPTNRLTLARCYLALLLVTYPFLTKAQKQGKPLADSLLQRLSLTREDTNKVAILDLLSFTYTDIDPNEGIKYGQQAMQLSKKLKWQKGTAAANADLAVNYQHKSDYTRALQYHQQALSIYEQMGNKANVAGVMVNMALIYVAQSNYPKALEYDFKALKTFDSLGHKKNCAVIMENIGSIYFEQKQYDKTQQYYTQAYNTYKALNDREGMAGNLGNLGMVFDAKGDYAKALQYHTMALELHRALGNRNYMQIHLANIGYVYNHMKDYPRALDYQLQALKISRDYDDQSSIAVNLGNIGETYLCIVTDSIYGRYTGHSFIPATRRENLARAIAYLDSATLICRRVQFNAPLVEFSQYLSQAYYLSGDYKKAFEALQLHTAMKDSVYTVQNNIQIANLETQRQLDLKNKDIEISKLRLLETRNEHVLYIVSIILLLLIIAIGVVVVFTYRKSNRGLLREKKRHLSLIRQQVTHIKAQADVLDQIADMQSHNVRGPVATILGLVKLFNFEDLADPTNKVVIEGIASLTDQLDIAVQEVIKKENDFNK